MKKTIWTGLLAATLVVSAPAFSQTAGQDLKDAGHDTKSATKATGRGIKKGTKTGYRKTKNGTKKAYHKTGSGIAKVGDKMDGKPSPQ